jgi:hypothetical protein
MPTWFQVSAALLIFLVISVAWVFVHRIDLKGKREKIFDRVARHLLTQCERATDNYGCVYKGPNGLRCAVGCLIPDDKYVITMENKPFNSEEMLAVLPEELHVDRGQLLHGPLFNLLVKLQRIHDRMEPKDWRNALGNIAKENGFHWPLRPQYAR